MNETCSPPNLTIRVNGNEQIVAAPANVSSLITLRAPRPPFAVEVNRKLVRRPDYELTPLRNGDIVEIVTLAGGG
jgi:sulfur carrier protein